MINVELRRRGPRSWCFAVVLVLALTTVLAINPSAVGDDEAAEVIVLSNRADLISAGDALVEVVFPRALDHRRIRVELGRFDVTSSFGMRDDGRYLGLVAGLEIGENTLTVWRARSVIGRIEITNHPRGGPVFSGEQVQPWLCTNATKLSRQRIDPMLSNPQVSDLKLIFDSA